MLIASAGIRLSTLFPQCSRGSLVSELCLGEAFWLSRNSRSLVECAVCLAISLQPADQQFPLVNHLGRQMRVQKNEQFFVPDHFRFPGCRGRPTCSFSNFSLGKSRPFHSMSS